VGLKIIVARFWLITRRRRQEHKVQVRCRSGAACNYSRSVAGQGQVWRGCRILLTNVEGRGRPYLIGSALKIKYTGTRIA
jgi:hypothetical protein